MSLKQTLPCPGQPFSWQLAPSFVDTGRGSIGTYENDDKDSAYVLGSLFSLVKNLFIGLQEVVPMSITKKTIKDLINSNLFEIELVGIDLWIIYFSKNSIFY
ncbi:MAG: hypothetical protein Roseis2KO_07410 [Roseivirga sp.]